MSDTTTPELQHFDRIASSIRRMIEAVKRGDFEAAQDELPTLHYAYPMLIDARHMIANAAPIFEAVRLHNRGGYGGKATIPAEQTLTLDVIENATELLQLPLWADEVQA